jgi:tRNA modification GTPase
VAAKSDSPEGLKKSGAAIQVSAVSGCGMADLKAAVADVAKKLLPPPDQFSVNQRQRALLADCADALGACQATDDWLIVAECLRQARLALDALTGRAHTEELLDTLFGKFCVGK